MGEQFTLFFTNKGKGEQYTSQTKKGELYNSRTKEGEAVFMNRSGSYIHEQRKSVLFLTPNKGSGALLQMEQNSRIGAAVETI